MSIRRSFLLLFFFTLSIHPSVAQTKYVDSLEDCFRTSPLVRNKLDAALNLSGNFIGRNLFDSAFFYIDHAIPLVQNDSFQDQLASLYSNKAIAYVYQGSNSQALNNIMRSLQISEKLKDSASLVNDYNIIGIIHLNLKAYEKAKAYWLKGLKINILNKNEESEIDSYGNLGNVEAELHIYDSALYYFEKSLVLTRKYKSVHKEIITMMNIGDVNIRMKKFQEALHYTLECLALSKSIGEEMKNPKVYLNLGLIYTGLKQNKLAQENFNKSLTLEKEINNPDDYRQIYQGMSNLFALENNYVKAYEYHQLYSNYSDSVYNNENLQSMSDIKTKYEVEKKEQEFKIQTEKEQLKNESELRKQKLIQIFLLIGFTMLAILAFFIFRSYRIKKKANDVITKQKEEIESKKAELESVYTEIQDSINYAQRIQQASLPDLEKLKDIFPDSSIVYRPKNVVSGDFYYFNEIIENNKRSFILAVCDCTGHGVPGAFMSMIGIEQLNKIIGEREVYQPSLILDALHNGVREALKQDINESRDGMDVVLCKITPSNDEIVIEYAGANRPLWILKKSENAYVFEEIKADKRAIGGLEVSPKQPFTNYKLSLNKGDCIYCSTDGYADQFGGTKGKKLMVKQFQSLLLEIAKHPMSLQEKKIIDSYKEWKGPLEQVDDVCVIGIKF
jgi:serine phosphatase RsbU (regulator of sigma subunit)/tetratricopeptide (TPR) repeat protein